MAASQDRNGKINIDTTKRPKMTGPIQRLRDREIGQFQRHERSVHGQIFHKLPGRLGFCLRNLVDESILLEGHVFLGFSKNGHFVLSYTFRDEADDHTAYPAYVYRLHWWRFIPYRKLTRVSEVRLFGEEETEGYLYLAVCEWPTDESRILVYGYCALSNEEKHLCYISITAVPPIGPCEDCSQLQILHTQSGYDDSTYKAPPRCINHGFTMHTKYELAPPYPSFAPKIYLKIDGVLIVNTGESLIAISADIEDNHGCFGFGLYSPRIARSMSSTDNSSHGADEFLGSPDYQERLSEPRPLDDVLENFTAIDPGIATGSSSYTSASQSVLGSNLTASPCTTIISPTPRPTNMLVPREQMHSDVLQPRPAHRERRASAGKENQINVSDSLTPTRHDNSSNSRLHRSPYDVYAFEANTPKREEPIDSPEMISPFDKAENSSSSSLSGNKVRTVLSYCSLPQSSTCKSEDKEIPFLPADESIDSQPLNGSDNPSTNLNSPIKTSFSSPPAEGVFQRPADLVRPRDHPLSPGHVGSIPTLRPLTMAALSLITGENYVPGKMHAFSPGLNKMDGGSSTCSSCVSTPVILQSESQCFTYSVRRYVEYFGRPESPVDVEDDLNLAYHSILPLEVHGANYTSMRLLTKKLNVPQTPCVTVKQLTLDIEHYLGEAVKTSAEWGHRYLSFTDYDVQILDVCPDTSEVVATVFVLIRARPPNPQHKEKHLHRAIPKMYQTGFRFVWNLKTGTYTTLNIEDLTEISQNDIFRTRWRPGNRISEMLQRRFAVPQEFCKGVHVLTNEAVFKGQSLKMLVDRHHYVAILL